MLSHDTYITNSDNARSVQQPSVAIFFSYVVLYWCLQCIMLAYYRKIGKQGVDMSMRDNH